MKVITFGFDEDDTPPIVNELVQAGVVNGPVVRLDCDYCSGAGEVAGSSTSYFTCPKCKGTGVTHEKQEDLPPSTC